MRDFVILFIILNISLPVNAGLSQCQGRFINPITDVCWECIMPITIAGITAKKGSAPRKRDTKNPKTPVCVCTKGNIPILGVTIGFWEPVRLVDVTRTPYCMVNLGGMQLSKNDLQIVGPHRKYDRKRRHTSIYHLHYYMYPLIAWLELITDFICLEPGSFDVAYLSELDPTWNDSSLQNLLNPDSILYANPIAQVACGADCAASTINMPLDSLHWCAGCWGNLFPLSGANADHEGGVRTSSLLTARIITKMHRVGMAQKTSTSDETILNGELCTKQIALRAPKSQYKLQMVYPKSTSGNFGCWPMGLSDIGYHSGKEYPYKGEDFGYLIWRKKNCCAF